MGNSNLKALALSTQDASKWRKIAFDIVMLLFVAEAVVLGSWIGFDLTGTLWLGAGFSVFCLAFTPYLVTHTLLYFPKKVEDVQNARTEWAYSLSLATEYIFVYLAVIVVVVLILDILSAAGISLLWGFITLPFFLVFNPSTCDNFAIFHRWLYLESRKAVEAEEENHA